MNVSLIAVCSINSHDGNVKKYGWIEIDILLIIVFFIRDTSIKKF